MSTGTPTLAGRTIAVTAERRAAEQADLFRRRGAEVLVAPTMHTVDLQADGDLRRATEDIVGRPPEWFVATTGYGMRLWFEAADAWGLGAALVAALATSRVVARGPKAQSACRQRGLEVEWRAPGESMDEVVAWITSRDRIAEATLAIQLFDPEDHPTTGQLERVAGSVRAVPVYRWRPPDDLAPARDLAHRIAGRRLDAVTFTSQPAVRFLLEVARDEGVLDELVDACNAGAVLPVCVGPVCAEPIAAAGIRTAVWPEPFRLVPMVKLAEELLAPTAFDEVDPAHEDAVGAVRAYVEELDDRFPSGFDPAAEPDPGAVGLSAPDGTFVLGRRAGTVVACGGVRTLGEGIGEIKRMWVAPDVRGTGLGGRLLAELEARSRALGHHTVRLDTNATLTEAIALYGRAGYREIERYNDNPDADRFFEKRIG